MADSGSAATERGHRRSAIWFRCLSAASRLASLALWVIVVYGTLVRFEAFHRSYGPLAGSEQFVRAQQVVADFTASLRPASLRWDRAEMPYRFDAKSYLFSAREMEHFYEARLREPAFVFATKVSLWITGGQDIAVSLASSVFGALAVPATFALGRAIGGAAVGLAAALLVAIEPQLIETGVRGYRDDLFTLLTVLFAWACIRLYRRASTRAVLLAALLAAAACLTRITAVTFVLPGLAAVVAFGTRGRWRDSLKPALVAAILALVLVAPFLVNCYVRFGDPLYSINWHSGFYGQRSGLETTEDLSTVEFLRRQFDRSGLAMVDSAIRGFTHYPWANKWTELGRHWGDALALALKYLCLIGLLMWLWPVEGRLALVVLAGSMAPFVFTWEAHTQWRFTQHAYPFYMAAAAFAVARPLGWLTDLVRSRQHITEDLGRAVVRTLVTAGVAAVFFAGMALLPPLIAYRDLTRGQPASVGGDGRMVLFVEREVFFFAGGWSPPITEGNVTFHDSIGNRGRLRVPMSSEHVYRCLVRLDPLSPADGLPVVEIHVNGSAYQTAKPDTSQGVATYTATIPRGIVTTGLNRVEIVAVGRYRPEAGGSVDRVGQPRPGFRFWYIRLFPQAPS